MEFLLKGVKHASDIYFNLIFVPMLDDGSFDNYFAFKNCKLIKNNLVVARKEKIYNLYWTKVVVSKDNVNVMHMETSLWHRRLSYIS